MYIYIHILYIYLSLNGHLHPHSLRGMTLTLFSAAELTSDVHWSPRKTEVSAENAASQAQYEQARTIQDSKKTNTEMNKENDDDNHSNKSH